MLTSIECQEMAKQKLVQAEHEPQRRIRLLTAAQGWLVLESELRRLEACVTPPGRAHAPDPSPPAPAARRPKISHQ
jgi:hypothetical protein